MLRVTEEPPLLTTAQVAERLGLHLRKVQRLAEAGELPIYLKVPGAAGRYLFDPQAVELWRYRQREQASA